MLLPALIASLLLFLLLGTEGTSQPNLYLSLSFIVGKSYESHNEACQRVGLKPTARIIPFDLNTTAAADISISILNYTSHTLEGCCASSIWCSDTSNTCFSQSYGLYYENYGWLSGNIESKPVFTCVPSSVPVGNTPVVSRIHQGLDDYEWDFNTQPEKDIYLYGSNYGFEKNITTISIAGQDCMEPEICSHVCALCGSSNGYSCPIDSECVQIGTGLPTRCFPYCAGPGDTSCPCNTKCVSVNFNYNPVIHLHLCTPESFGLSSNVCEGHEQEKIRCNSPHAKTADIQNQLSTHNFSISVGEEVTVGVLGTVIAASAQFTCDTDEDCNDGNICTSAICMSNKCVFSDIIGCNSTSSSVISRQTNFYYLSYVETGMTTEQVAFDEYMVAVGVRSSVSDVDDVPIDGPFSMQFDFPFFGERVNSLAINPNGLISLSPVNPCLSYPGTFACIVYSSFTNVISPWFRDWNLILNGMVDSNVYYLHQYSTDTTPVYGIASVDAFHVYYSNVLKYTNRNEPIASAQNSFSSSMYSDGSIRFRYSKIDEPVTYEDFSGLWSSRAGRGNDVSWLRNYKENVTQYIQTGNDVVFCPNFNTVVCASNTCVSPGDIYTMKMKQPSCIALDTTLNYVCRFAGIHVEPATFNSADGTISCTVPTLNEITFGSTVTVDVDVTTPSSSGATRITGVYLGAYTVTNITYTTWDGWDRWRTDSSQIMVRYVQNTLSCGCSALPSKIGFTCDECNVCGGKNSEKDCNGDCFGTAYHDTCGKCAGGLTGIIPSDQCDFEAYVLPPVFDLKDMLTLLLGACLILCSFSGCLFIVRRNMDMRRLRMMTLLAQGRAVVENGRRGLSEEEISYVRSFKFETNEESPTEEGGSLLEGATECSICLGEFVNGDECRRLPEPCSHTFHTACIDEWLKLSSACPLCKRSLRELVPQLNSSGNNGICPNTSASTRRSTSPSSDRENTVVEGGGAVVSSNDRNSVNIGIGSGDIEIHTTMLSPAHTSLGLTTNQVVSSGSPSASSRAIIPVITGVIDSSASLSLSPSITAGRVVDVERGFGSQMQVHPTDSITHRTASTGGSSSNDNSFSRSDFFPVPTESPTDISTTNTNVSMSNTSPNVGNNDRSTTLGTSSTSATNNETRNLIDLNPDNTKDREDTNEIVL